MSTNLCFKLLVILSLLLLVVLPVFEQGPITLAICQAGCAAIAVACYAAAGAVCKCMTAATAIAAFTPL